MQTIHFGTSSSAAVTPNEIKPIEPSDADKIQHKPITVSGELTLSEIQPIV